MKGKILAPLKQCPSLVMNLHTTGADSPLRATSYQQHKQGIFSCAYPLTLRQVFFLMKSILKFLCSLIRSSELLCACIYANHSRLKPQPKFLQNLATSTCISLLLLFAFSDASFIILSFLPPSSHSCIWGFLTCFVALLPTSSSFRSSKRKECFRRPTFAREKY